MSKVVCKIFLTMILITLIGWFPCNIIHFLPFRPYGSPKILVFVQALTGVTLALSICGWWLTWLFGFKAFFLIMILACVPVSGSLVFYAGSLMCCASISQITFAFLAAELNVYCKSTTTTDDGSNAANQNCDSVIKVYIAFGIITAIGWFISSVTTFVMLRTLRDNDDPTLSAWGNRVMTQPGGSSSPPKSNTTVMTGSGDPAPTQSNASVPIQQLPDTGQSMEEMVHNAHGMTTVTERMEPYD